MHLINLKQRSHEWLKWRKNKITAADSPIILGHSPFKSIERLYEEKIRCYDEPCTYYMQRGIDLEPIALRSFENETGLIMFPAVGIHDEIDWMAASFDGMTIEGDVICEIKCPGKKDHEEAINGNVPKKYYPQLQHQIHVAGIDFSYYFSFDGNKGVIIEVKRDQDFIDKMIEKEFEFWQCLQTFTPPQTQSRTRKRKDYDTTALISGCI